MADLDPEFQALLASPGSDAPPAPSGSAHLDPEFQALLAGGKGSHSFDVIAGKAVPTGSPEAVAARDPTANMSPMERQLAGAGKFASDLYTGSQQAGSNLLSKVLPSFAAVNTQANTDAANARENDAPLMATAAGKAGYLMGALPTAALPGANTATGAALIGGAMGGLSPTIGDESRLKNTAMGAGFSLAGKAVGDTLGRLIAPKPAAAAATALTGAQQQALQGGAAVGMRATPGQQTGSTALQQIEAKLESQPWSAGPFAAIKSGNQRALNAAVAQSIGENGHTVDASVLSSANDRLGNVFESVRDPKKIVITNPAATTTEINQIDQTVRGLLPGNASVRDNPLVADLERMTSGGAINAQQLGQLSSKLGKAAYKHMSSPSGDRDWGQALYAVKDHVDDLVQQSLTPAEQAEYAAARGQYRNLMMLTSRTNVVNPSTGDVSGANLANKLQQADKRGFLYGGNRTPMYQAARFAQAFKPIVGNSGTATRSANLTNLSELPLGLLSNVGSRAYLSGPGSAAVRGVVGGARGVQQLGGLLGNRFPALQGLLNSPANAGLGAALLPYFQQQ